MTEPDSLDRINEFSALLVELNNNNQATESPNDPLTGLAKSISHKLTQYFTLLLYGYVYKGSLLMLPFGHANSISLQITISLLDKRY